MTSTTTLMRRELRELRLRLDGIGDLIAGQEIDRHIAGRIARQQESSEHEIHDVGLSNSGFAAIRSLWPMGPKTVTLEDLSYFERDEISGLDGVGKVTMQKLDAAMADAGLAWA